MDSKSENTPPMRIVGEGGFVIFRRNPSHDQIEYLILQSSRRSSGRQSWGPPKGHMEKGENEEETAWRELQEETGLVTENVKVMENFKHVVKYTKDDKKCKPGTNGKKMLIVHMWLAELIDPHYPIQISHEHHCSKWSPLTDAKELMSTRGGSDQYIEYFEKCEQKIRGSC